MAAATPCNGYRNPGALKTGLTPKNASSPQPEFNSAGMFIN